MRESRITNREYDLREALHINKEHERKRERLGLGKWVGKRASLVYVGALLLNMTRSMMENIQAENFLCEQQH